MYRPALWLLLVLSGVVNLVTSLADLHILINIASGLVSLGSAAALIRHHYRHRRPTAGLGS
ncbi:hypothetical protein [Nonomuraea sp. SYSU D8015]|uniref:hypothetical protein n=1 Tax=Nonomuraea sp. SYSU D8015 TaxID=2593644 RepID=UPI00166057B1|nr:hypothetical protein [Nonomuraea sp. SYSU D8015]